MAQFVRVTMPDGSQLIFAPADYSAVRNRPHGQHCGEGCCPTPDITVYGFTPEDADELTVLLKGHSVIEEPLDRIAELFSVIRPAGLKRATSAQIRSMQTIFNRPGWQPPHLRS